MYINFLTKIPLYDGVMTSYNILGDIYLFETIPEISEKMAPACVVICIRLMRDGFLIFIRKYIGRKHFFRYCIQQKD